MNVNVENERKKPIYYGFFLSFSSSSSSKVVDLPVHSPALSSWLVPSSMYQLIPVWIIILCSLQCLYFYGANINSYNFFILLFALLLHNPSSYTSPDACIYTFSVQLFYIFVLCLSPFIFWCRCDRLLPRICRFYLNKLTYNI